MQFDNSAFPEQPASVDTIAIVVVHDGPSLSSDDIIAPIVGDEASSPDFHNHFQDAEKFLAAGGRRGRPVPGFSLTERTLSIDGLQPWR